VLARSLEQDHAHVVVLLGLERVALDVAQQLLGESIAALWPVESDRRDVTVLLVQDVGVIGHA
jgi:hypothetical protein